MQYTGLQPAAALPAPEALLRAGWIAANIDSMGALLDVVGDRLAGGGGLLGGVTRGAAGIVMSVEAGALTGYLSQRVLGQYEFAMVDPQAPARLLFVAPNIAEAAQRLEADPEELLRWIAFHEVTHAVQFSGVPWLRPYLAGLLSELLASLEVKIDARALLRLPSLDDVRGLVDALKEGGIVAALGGDRRELFDKVQGVMGVVEGHAEHVMDVVGAEALPSLNELRTALDRRRRERPPAARAAREADRPGREDAPVRGRQALLRRHRGSRRPAGAAQRLRWARAVAERRRAARPRGVDAPHRGSRRRVAHGRGGARKGRPPHRHARR